MLEKHNISITNHKVRFNRESKKHNLVFNKHNIMFYLVCSLVSLTCLTSLVLSHLVVSSSYAESSNAAVTVSAACTMNIANTGTHTAEIIPGGIEEIVSDGINVSCNDAGGYALYAIGYSGDSYTASNHTKLISTLNSDNDIATNTSGANSYWAMKITASGTNAPSIDNSFGSYQQIPDTYTEVSHRTTSTAGTNNSVTTPTYKVSIASNQIADTYTGQVKYTLVHPNTAAEPTVVLYNIVANMSKGKQTATDLQANITIPTSSDYTQDTSNSGVYEYDPNVFGVSSDASNDYTIYYYRGVLENSVGSYGSDGNAVTYPNYVILDADGNRTTADTCWRIVRTTGSGGVKMIYNGTWTGTTCANATTSAQVATKFFNYTSSSDRQIVRVGYTYNSTYATNTTKSGTIAQIFGTNSNPSVNNTRSTIKQYIEDTWYASNMKAYTSILEPSAGYCNDRTMYADGNYTAPLVESSIIDATYGAGTASTNLQPYNFGAYARNATSADQPPSLACAKYSGVDRSTVDLYRYVANSTGVSNELKYPVAPLTADEASFAGSGNSTATNGSSYHANSFLCSGSYFWLLSPRIRSTGGWANVFYLPPEGHLKYANSTSAYGVRPAISLQPGTTASSGSGTATDPWVVTAP